MTGWLTKTFLHDVVIRKGFSESTFSSIIKCKEVILYTKHLKSIQVCSEFVLNYPVEDTNDADISKPGQALMLIIIPHNALNMHLKSV